MTAPVEPPGPELGHPTRAAARWRALGTYVFLAVDDPALLDEAEDLARRVIDRVDRACSRFRSDSDLTRANASPGSWVAVDPLLVQAASVAVEAAEVTDGLVDPCLGRTIVALGYDADMDVVRARAPHGFDASEQVAPRPGAWRELRLDEQGAVRVPTGTALDLGATAKAWASDLVTRTVVEGLGCRCVVSLGGDIRIDGPEEADTLSWPVGISEFPEPVERVGQRSGPDEAPPSGPGPGMEVVWVTGGGIATSSTRARRWRVGDSERHHVLDPDTGESVPEYWRTVTATGSTCVAANTAATAALVLAGDAVPWLEAREVTARLVSSDGQVRTVGSWPERPVVHLPSPREGRD